MFVKTSEDLVLVTVLTALGEGTKWLLSWNSRQGVSQNSISRNQGTVKSFVTKICVLSDGPCQE